MKGITRSNSSSISYAAPGLVGKGSGSALQQMRKLHSPIKEIEESGVEESSFKIQPSPINIDTAGGFKTTERMQRRMKNPSETNIASLEEKSEVRGNKMEKSRLSSSSSISAAAMKDQQHHHRQLSGFAGKGSPMKSGQKCRSTKNFRNSKSDIPEIVIIKNEPQIQIHHTPHHALSQIEGKSPTNKFSQSLLQTPHSEEGAGVNHLKISGVSQYLFRQPTYVKGRAQTPSVGGPKYRLEGDSSGRQSPLLTARVQKTFILKRKISTINEAQSRHSNHSQFNRHQQSTMQNLLTGVNKESALLHIQHQSGAQHQVFNHIADWVQSKLLSAQHENEIGTTVPVQPQATDRTSSQGAQTSHEKRLSGTTGQVPVVNDDKQDTQSNQQSSPLKQQRLEKQVYGFKTLPKDSRINIPTLAGFFGFLAGLILNPDTKQDVMLNIPETIILHQTRQMAIGEKASPTKKKNKSKSPQKKVQIADLFDDDDLDEDPYNKNFIYLSNPKVVPSEGNLPSLPLVQKLICSRHPKFKDANDLISSWLRDLNIKKIKQHAESRAGQEVYLPVCVSKRVCKHTGEEPQNAQSLDFYEESAYYRLKLQFAKGHDAIMQRYIPARSNKNSIIRVVWQRGTDDKAPSSAHQGGFFKMYQVSANKQYDGQISQDKFSPSKKVDPLKKIQEQQANAIFEVSPAAVKKNEFWDMEDENGGDDPDNRPEPILNAKFMQKLRDKYKDEAFVQENYGKMSTLLKKPPLDVMQKLLIQDEIDQVKAFQYQFCTSDKYPQKNYVNELSLTQPFKSEIFYQAEQVIRLLNGYIKRETTSVRRLSVGCFDFIQDYTDRRWKFLNLKYFHTEENSSEIIDRDIYLMKSIISRGSAPHGFDNIKLKSEDEPHYLKQSRCMGDYCQILIDNHTTDDKLGPFGLLAKKHMSSTTGFNQSARYNSSIVSHSLPFGYLRDTVKLLAFQQHILSAEFNLHPRKHGLGEDQALVKRPSPKNMHMQHQLEDYFQVVKKVIYLDRMRRKAIQEGHLKDIEHFQFYKGDRGMFFTNTAAAVAANNNDQSTARNTPASSRQQVNSAYEKVKKLQMMLQEIISFEDVVELGKFLQSEHQKIISQQQTMKQMLFEQATVCTNCMRIYKFLSDLYSRIEEQIELDDLNEDSLKRSKSNVFMGLDPRLSEKVLKILKRQQQAATMASGTTVAAPLKSNKRILSPIQRPPQAHTSMGNRQATLGKLEALAASSRTNDLISFGSTFRTTNTFQDSRPMSQDLRGMEIDLSIMRDRDMIPDLPFNLYLQSSKAGSNNMYLPPVTINDYLCQQKKIQRMQGLSEQGTLPPLAPNQGKHKRKKSRKTGPLKEVFHDQNQINNIPLRSRSSGMQGHPRSMPAGPSDKPMLSVVSKWHIKNYQPTVYDEIQKLMKKKKVKLVKKKKRQTSQKADAPQFISIGSDNEGGRSPSIEDVVNKYYTISQQDDFSGPIIPIVLDDEMANENEEKEKNDLSLRRPPQTVNQIRKMSPQRYNIPTDESPMMHIQVYNQEMLLPSKKDYLNDDIDIVKMPPVQRSSLTLPNEEAQHVSAMAKHLHGKKFTPAFHGAYGSSLNFHNNLSVVLAAQQSFEEDGSTDSQGRNKLVMLARQGDNGQVYIDDQEQIVGYNELPGDEDSFFGEKSKIHHQQRGIEGTMVDNDIQFFDNENAVRESNGTPLHAPAN